MARVTEEEVLAILDTSVTAASVAPFIDAATALVSESLSDQGYGTALLREIERWLAAHLVAIYDPEIAEEEYGDARTKYFGKVGMKLEATKYGQQVMVLDANGVLAGLQASKGAATVEVLDIIDGGTS